jgi:Xaa-Pro dipeptidase
MHDGQPCDHASLASRRELLGLGAAFAGASLAACAAGGERRREDEPERSADARAELDAMFAELTDQRSSVQPIQPAERAARRARLASLLARSDCDAFLCEGGATMDYLAGVRWGHSERTFALVVLADGRHFWISPAFEAEKARLAIGAPDGPGGEIATWQEDEYAWKPAHDALHRYGADGRIALDPATRLFIAASLAEELGSERILCAERVVRDLRAVKDAHELELLRKASELTKLAIAAAARTLRPGITAAEVSRRMRHAQGRLGLTGTWDLSLVGPAAAYPHGGDRSRPIQAGELLLVDTGGALHGYQSDVTRTWLVDGELGADELRAWHAVRDAQLRAFEAIRPGVPCKEIDRAARASLERAGFGSGYSLFTHRLGHGIGLEGHEPPYFDGGSDVRLEPGMTLSDEPGLYLYGRFGVRLEDIVAVIPDGAEHFGDWQGSPQAPA